MNLRQYIQQYPRHERRAVREGLAQAIGVSEITIRSYANGHRQVPATLARPLSRATGGQVLPEHVRPDVFGAEVAA